MKREYDFIFSLGFSCAGTQALRYAGLQNASYPLDWTGSPGLLASVGMIERDFAGWFAREDLKLWDVRIEYGHVSRVYKNLRTGFGFTHEFTNAKPFETGFDEVRGKYDRRIVRFMDRLRSARRVLAVYVTDPRQARPSDGELSEARRRLADKFRQATFDLTCAHVLPDVRVPRETVVEDGLVAVGMDYRTFLNGELMHVCDFDQFRRYLQDRVALAGVDGEAARRRFRESQKRGFAARFGGTWFQRRVNRKLCDLFHDVGRYLIGQGLVPGDRPLWFDGTGM